jgi:hypothetical protein
MRLGVFWDIKNLKEITKNGSIQILDALYNSIDNNACSIGMHQLFHQGVGIKCASLFIFGELKINLN